MKERMKQRLLSLLLAVGMICSLTAGMPCLLYTSQYQRKDDPLLYQDHVA